MGSMPPLRSLLLFVVLGWVHRHQLIVIEFLQAANRLRQLLQVGRNLIDSDAGALHEKHF